MHKFGTYEFMGSFYEGNFMLNVMEGNGIFEFTDGSIYTGQFQEGKPCTYLICLFIKYLFVSRG